jgi:capsule polysaccharide export protein KpsE/RkpR
VNFPRILQPTSIQKLRANELHQAERDLLQAKTAAENWNATVQTLESRIARLRKDQGAQ